MNFLLYLFHDQYKSLYYQLYFEIILIFPKNELKWKGKYLYRNLISTRSYLQLIRHPLLL